MPTEDEKSESKTPSISSRTRSRIRQDPIVTAPGLTVQDVDDILQSSSSSKTDSEVSDFEEDIDPTTQQYNPRTLQFPTTTASAMAPSSPFDEDLLYIFTDVLKIDLTKKPLHVIPAGILHYGVVSWEDFYVLDPIEISTFTYPTTNNTRTNLPPSVVTKLQFLLNLINKCIDNGVDNDSRGAKSYNAADFKVWFEQSWKLRRDNSAAARAT